MASASETLRYLILCAPLSPLSLNWLPPAFFLHYCPSLSLFHTSFHTPLPLQLTSISQSRSLTLLSSSFFVFIQKCIDMDTLPPPFSSVSNLDLKKKKKVQHRRTELFRDLVASPMQSSSSSMTPGFYYLPISIRSFPIWSTPVGLMMC